MRRLEARTARCRTLSTLFAIWLAAFYGAELDGLSQISSSLGLISVARAEDMAAAPPVQSPQPVMPEAEVILILIRTTLLTLNDAVQTGNFTVLRDVATPGFRELNSAAKLSRAFEDLAQRGVNLAAVATIAPKLGESPSIDPASGMLRIKGVFPGTPVQIAFDLTYQVAGGRWRLFSLSVDPQVVAPVDGAAPANVPAASPKSSGAGRVPAKPQAAPISPSRNQKP